MGEGVLRRAAEGTGLPIDEDVPVLRELDVPPGAPVPPASGVVDTVLLFPLQKGMRPRLTELDLGPG